MKISIRRNRKDDALDFWVQGCCVATLFDGRDEFVFDELAYSPALLEGGGTHLIEDEFKRLGLDAPTARYIDACPELSYPPDDE
jgi:hypothetical protein